MVRFQKPAKYTSGIRTRTLPIQSVTHQLEVMPLEVLPLTYWATLPNLEVMLKNNYLSNNLSNLHPNFSFFWLFVLRLRGGISETFNKNFKNFKNFKNRILWRIFTALNISLSCPFLNMFGNHWCALLVKTYVHWKSVKKWQKKTRFGTNAIQGIHESFLKLLLFRITKEASHFYKSYFNFASLVFFYLSSKTYRQDVWNSSILQLNMH